MPWDNDETEATTVEGIPDFMIGTPEEKPPTPEFVALVAIADQLKRIADSLEAIANNQ